VTVGGCADYAEEMRALTPAEAAALVAVGGSVLAVVVPAFVRNVHASYVSEATSGVSELAQRTAARLEADATPSALPAPAPLTPSAVPRGLRVKDPPGTWEHPTWRALAFAFDTPHAYSFEYQSEATGDALNFRAIAHGDLDGDTILSTVEMGGRCQPGRAPVLSALDVAHEIE
jgi:hypothetical protein